VPQEPELERMPQDDQEERRSREDRRRACFHVPDIVAPVTSLLTTPEMGDG